MRKAVYSDEDIMRNIVSAERYVDDGAGLYNDSVDSFNSWIVSVNEKLSPFGITIDESSIWLPNDFIAFLDIQLCFDSTGSLQTDLYTKPTDSRAYLNFDSAHPKHTFSGTVQLFFVQFHPCINLV